MKFFHHLRLITLWTLEIILVTVWVATLWELALVEGEMDDVLWAFVVLALLVILYFGEGIEIAVADLLDKQPDQLSDESVRSVLKEIQERRGFFFAQRQIFVVVIIAFMSLMTSYRWLYVPGFGRVESFELPFWFSLVFTTLTVLWFCQVTPKRLAVINSERFLKQSKFLWPVIKVMGKLGLPGPSDQIVSLMERWSGYKQKRHLRPSRAAHYDITAQLYGFSLDRLSVEISVEDDGSATIVQRLLVLFVRGEHMHIHGRVDTQSAFLSPPRITPLALYTRPMIEQFESIANDLDSIFNGEDRHVGNGFSKNLIDEWAYQIETDKVTKIDGYGEEASWIIRSLRPLPESLWSQTDPSNGRQPPFAALLYQVEAEVSRGAFDFPGTHHWDEYIQFPCRDLSLSMRIGPEVEAEVGLPRFEVGLHNLNTPLMEETERCAQLVRSAMISGTRSVRIPYPVQGAIYRIYWELMRRPSEDSNAKEFTEGTEKQLS